MTEFVFNGHLQSLGGVGVVYVASVMLYGEPAKLVLLVLAYLVLQVVYVFDRYRGLEGDKKTNSKRSKHLVQYWQYIPVILAGMLAVMAGILYVYGNMALVVFTLAIVVLGLLYPVYFKDITKRIYLFKNIYVAGVYAIFVFYPALFIGDTTLLGALSWVIFGYVFLEMLIVQFALDVKDVKSDGVAGYYTLPVLIGMEKTMLALRFLAIVSFLVFLGSRIFFVLLLFNLVLNYILARDIENKKVRGYLLAAGKFFGWLLMGVGISMVV